MKSRSATASRKTAALVTTQDSRSPGHFWPNIKVYPMRLIVKQTECAGKMFWIVKDADHAWSYYGPYADETAAHAFARSGNWKELLRTARMNRKAALAA
jgi:hypothetical protein